MRAPSHVIATGQTAHCSAPLPAPAPPARRRRTRPAGRSRDRSQPRRAGGSRRAHDRAVPARSRPVHPARKGCPRALPRACAAQPSARGPHGAASSGGDRTRRPGTGRRTQVAPTESAGAQRPHWRSHPVPPHSPLVLPWPPGRPLRRRPTAQRAPAVLPGRARQPRATPDHRRVPATRARGLLPRDRTAPSPPGPVRAAARHACSHPPSPPAHAASRPPRSPEPHVRPLAPRPPATAPRPLPTRPVHTPADARTPRRHLRPRRRAAVPLRRAAARGQPPGCHRAPPSVRSSARTAAVSPARTPHPGQPVRDRRGVRQTGPGQGGGVPQRRPISQDRGRLGKLPAAGPSRATRNATALATGLGPGPR